MDVEHQGLIDLKSFPAHLEGSRYVVIHSCATVALEELFCLTPHVMRWSPRVYLFDLHSCIDYWRQRSRRLGMDCFALYKKMLRSVFGNEYIAVFCAHPWQGLLLLYQLVDNGTAGAHVLNNPFNRKAYRRLSWKHWFAALSDLAVHLEAIRARRFNASAFRAKAAQMRRFIRRLDLSGPDELSEADAAAIARRYSGWIGEAWRWTFLPVETGCGADAESHEGRFPWRSLMFKQSLRIDRHLDYPVSQWQTVEFLLKQDLAGLCRLGHWSPGDKINRLYWHINLFNLERMTVKIKFRNPYALHREAPEFRSALYQAYYAYTDMMRTLSRRDHDLDLPAEMPFISWQLEIKQRLRLPPVLLDLFGDENQATSYERILDLQNCLPQDMEHYAIVADFVPEQLFMARPPGGGDENDFLLQQWLPPVLPRPLFYYSRPRPLAESRQQDCRFLERTACNWWRSENTEDHSRDYFMLRNRQGQYLWVFRNHAGEWYQHGIYS